MYVLVVVDSLGPRGLRLSRLLCPWDFPGKDIGVGCHFLLQGIFLMQESNLGLLHYRRSPALQADSLPLSHQGTLYHNKHFKLKNIYRAPDNVLEALSLPLLFHMVLSAPGHHPVPTKARTVSYYPVSAPGHPMQGAVSNLGHTLTSH